jgi:plasmid replication initiation protein
MLLAQIKPNDEDFKGYRIAVLDFAKIAGIRPDNIYERLEATAQGLLSRTIKIKNGKSFLMANWLSSAEYRHGSGYIELCFDPKLKPYLLQLQDHFTRLEVDKVLHFKSVYSVRLYELLKKEAQIVEKYQNKKHFEKEFSYIELREAFGIEKKEYKLFANFKKKTIEPAVTEIYDKTELNISDVKYGKTGRAVSKITFVVDIRSKAEGDVRAVQMQIEEPKDNKKETIKQRLVELGYSPEYASRDVNKHGIQRIERSIAFTLAKQQEGKVKDFPAYLSRVIEGDLGGAWEQAVIDGKSKVEKVKQEAKEREEQKKREEKEKEEAGKKTLQCFYAFPVEVQNMIKQNFAKTIEDNDFVYPRWKQEEKEGRNPIDLLLIKGSFILFLRENNICS